MNAVALAPNGRVLIPAFLREACGFKPNTKLMAEVRDGSLVLTAPDQHYKRLRNYFDARLPGLPQANSVDDFIAERRAEALRDNAQ